MTDHVQIFELGPRDGLQNESKPLIVEIKVALIEKLIAAGLKTIEAGAFVSPKWVPQMAGSGEVLSAVAGTPGIAFPVLTPNLKGYEAAKRASAKCVAVFTSASESFNQKNINCSTAESLQRFKPIFEAAAKDGIRVRGYVSNVLGCPYEGAVPSRAVVELATVLLEQGSYEVSLCDTIGVGTPIQAKHLIKDVQSEIAIEHIAGHFHDTYGQALANSFAWLEEGVRVFDVSVSGLGGCPFAKGASGNLATEDFIYTLERSGLNTGVDLEKLIDASFWISQQLDRAPASHVTAAMRPNDFKNLEMEPA